MNTGLFVLGEPPLSPSFHVTGREGTSYNNLESGTPETDLNHQFSDQENLVLDGDGRAGGTVVVTDIFNGVFSTLGTVSVTGTANAVGMETWSMALTTPLADGIHWLVATSTDAEGNTSPPSPSLLVNSVPTLSVDGRATQAGTYTADTGSHYAVVTGGEASFVANASSASSMTVYGNSSTINFTNGGSGVVVGTG